MLKAKPMFLKFFDDNTIKIFSGQSNIVLILAPGGEFFSTKFARCPLRFTE